MHHTGAQKVFPITSRVSENRQDGEGLACLLELICNSSGAVVVVSLVGSVNSHDSQI